MSTLIPGRQVARLPGLHAVPYQASAGGRIGGKFPPTDGRLGVMATGLTPPPGEGAPPGSGVLPRATRARATRARDFTSSRRWSCCGG